MQAAGLTEAQLESSINQAYKDAGLIQNATVSVSVLEARNRTYTISGAVGNPGEYQILSSDFRLLNALNYARNVTSTGIDYVYVVRKAQPNAGAGAGTGPATRPNTDVLMPRGQANHNMEGAVAQGSIASHRVSMLTQPMDAPATTPATQPDQSGRIITIEGRPVDTNVPPPKPHRRRRWRHRPRRSFNRSRQPITARWARSSLNRHRRRLTSASSGCRWKH